MPDDATHAKIALITGAGSGMGLLYTQQLLAQGWAVAALDIQTEALSALPVSKQLLIIKVDVRSQEAIHDAVTQTEQTLGPIHRVVNAAAVMHLGRILDQDINTIRNMTDINYYGLLNVAFATLPLLLKRGAGEFVSFASLAGHMPIYYMGSYSATKFATVALTETLYYENRGHGVQFVCVCPPAVQTPLLNQSKATHWPKLLDFIPPISPEQVLTSLDNAIAKQKFWVFPGPLTRITLMCRRIMPRLLWWTVKKVEKL